MEPLGQSPETLWNFLVLKGIMQRFMKYGLWDVKELQRIFGKPAGLTLLKQPSILGTLQPLSPGTVQFGPA